MECMIKSWERDFAKWSLFIKRGMGGSPEGAQSWSFNTWTEPLSHFTQLSWEYLQRSILHVHLTHKVSKSLPPAPQSSYKCGYKCARGWGEPWHLLCRSCLYYSLFSYWTVPIWQGIKVTHLGGSILTDIWKLDVKCQTKQNIEVLWWTWWVVGLNKPLLKCYVLHVWIKLHK